jgi:hypothetical protein
MTGARERDPRAQSMSSELTEKRPDRMGYFLVIARSEATKQSMHRRTLPMDCFAALAMTV